MQISPFLPSNDGPAPVSPSDRPSQRASRPEADERPFSAYLQDQNSRDQAAAARGSQEANQGQSPSSESVEEPPNEKVEPEEAKSTDDPKELEQPARQGESDFGKPQPQGDGAEMPAVEADASLESDTSERAEDGRELKLEPGDGDQTRLSNEGFAQGRTVPEGQPVPTEPELQAIEATDDKNNSVLPDDEAKLVFSKLGYGVDGQTREAAAKLGLSDAVLGRESGVEPGRDAKNSAVQASVSGLEPSKASVLTLTEESIAAGKTDQQQPVLSQKDVEASALQVSKATNTASAGAHPQTMGGSKPETVKPQSSVPNNATEHLVERRSQAGQMESVERIHMVSASAQQATATYNAVQMAQFSAAIERSSDKRAEDVIGAIREASTPSLETQGARDTPRVANPDARVVQSVAQQLVTHARALPNGAIEVALQPEELGRVRMTVTMTEAGLQVVVSAERMETADLMRRNLDLLMEDFRALGHENVSLEFGSNFESDSGDQGGTDQDERGLDYEKVADPAALTASVLSMASEGRIDIRV